LVVITTLPVIVLYENPGSHGHVSIECRAVSRCVCVLGSRHCESVETNGPPRGMGSTMYRSVGVKPSLMYKGFPASVAKRKNRLIPRLSALPRAAPRSRRPTPRPLAAGFTYSLMMEPSRDLASSGRGGTSWTTTETIPSTSPCSSAIQVRKWSSCCVLWMNALVSARNSVVVSTGASPRTSSRKSSLIWRIRSRSFASAGLICIPQSCRKVVSVSPDHGT